MPRLKHCMILVIQKNSALLRHAIFFLSVICDCCCEMKVNAFFFCFFLSETTEKRTAHKIWLLRTQVRKRTVEMEYYFLLKPNHPTRAVKKSGLLVECGKK